MPLKTQHGKLMTSIGTINLTLHYCYITFDIDFFTFTNQIHKNK